MITTTAILMNNLGYREIITFRLIPSPMLPSINNCCFFNFLLSDNLFNSAEEPYIRWKPKEGFHIL